MHLHDFCQVLIISSQMLKKKKRVVTFFLKCGGERELHFYSLITAADDSESENSSRNRLSHDSCSTHQGMKLQRVVYVHIGMSQSLLSQESYKKRSFIFF